MTCRELIEFLMSYLDGELPSPERTEFDRHLGICTDCNEYLDSYRETVRLGKILCQDPDGPPPGIPEDLVAAILAARQKSSPDN